MTFSLNSYKYWSCFGLVLLLLYAIQQLSLSGHPLKSNCDFHTQIVRNLAEPNFIFTKVESCIPTATFQTKAIISSILSVELANRNSLERSIELFYAHWLQLNEKHEMLANISLGIGQLNVANSSFGKDTSISNWMYIDKLAKDDCFNIQQLSDHLLFIHNNMDTSNSINSFNLNSIFNLYHGHREGQVDEITIYSCVSKKIYDELIKVRK